MVTKDIAQSDGGQAVMDSLRITREQWSKLLWDPVMAAYVLFGAELDAFQGVRLRKYWFVPNKIDSSGVSSGKTICIWLYLNLRTALIPEHDAAIYYPVFETLKNSFWDYYGKIRNPVFRSQLGKPMAMEAGEKEGEDGTLHGAACYKAFYRNGNKVLGPAPSFMKDAVTQASLRVNTLVIEEWTHVDASSDGINKQLIDRTTKPGWNQYHPVWANHILFSAHAQTLMHPSSKRYKDHQRKVNAGEPTFDNFSFSYKDFSGRRCHTGKSFRQQYRIDGTINAKRNTCSATEWKGQGFGIWGASGTGWFSEDAILQCVANGRVRGVKPVLSRAQFLGG